MTVDLNMKNARLSGLIRLISNGLGLEANGLALGCCRTLLQVS